MATEGDKQRKEATKPSGNARPAAGRAKTASRAGAKPAGRSTGGSNRPAGRAASKPADKAGAAKTAAKPAASKPAKGGAAKPASRTARGATATAKAERGAKPAAKSAKSEEAVGDGAGVNREMKRMMKKREGAADRLRRPPTAPGRKRTKPLTFLKEVRGELGRVAWPTRQEVMTYSVVVLVTVIFFMVVIAGIDYVALKGVLFLIERGGR